jgi:hypothetical protein
MIHSTRLHVVLYSFLLVFTPFIVLQNFLMDMIATASSVTVRDIPVVPVVTALLLAIAAAVFRRRLTRRLLGAILVVALINAAAQSITDYYFDQKFYDLLQNWHYIAYALFAPMMYRDLAPRRIPLARILWITYVCALCFSVFDEGFQRALSNRVFDLSDTAKDLTGCLMGLILVTIAGTQWPGLRPAWRAARETPPSAHFANPLVSLALMTVFTFIYLGCTSLQSDAVYAGVAILMSMAASLVVVAVYFLLFRRWGRIVVGAAGLAVVGIVGGGFLLHHDDQIVHNRHGLTVYKGIPIPFFDVMIYPDGTFRLVDRKHAFTARDQQLMLRQRADIILLGTGSRGQGGRGFPEQAMVQFLHNPHLGRGTQVIRLTTPEACKLFNRLKQEKKSVLFIVHNTC